MERRNEAPISDIAALKENLRQAEGNSSYSGDVAEQFLANWKNIVTGILLLIGLAIGLQFMKESRARVRANASQKLEGVQRDFSQLFFSAEALSEEGKAQLRRAFEDKLKAIQDIDNRSIYARLAELYRAANEMRAGELAQARERMKPFDVSMLRSGKKLDSEDLLNELALLMKAKVLVSDESTKMEGKELLRTLTIQSKIVAGEALVAYNTLFGEDGELSEQAYKAHPALREVIAKEQIGGIPN